MSHRPARLALIAAIVLLPLTACGEADSGPTTSPAGEPGPGQVLYLTYCQSCHGSAGKGDGPVASSLRAKPSDLTLLWKSYGTPLDREKLAKYVDGRRLLDLRGSREMPIWGDEFFENANPDTPNVESAKRHLIEVLIGYLETLQTNRRT